MDRLPFIWPFGESGMSVVTGKFPEVPCNERRDTYETRCGVPRELWTRDDDVSHGSVQVCRGVVDCRLAIIFFQMCIVLAPVSSILIRSCTCVQALLKCGTRVERYEQHLVEMEAERSDILRRV